MCRAAVLVLALASSACKDKPAAQPPPAPAAAKSTPAPAKHATRPPTLLATAFTSSFAQTSNTASAWTGLAETYEAELADCKVECRELAYQVVLARNSALKAANLQPPPGDSPGPLADREPPPLPPEVQANVDALDAFVERLDPTDDDVAGMKFLAANSLWHWRQPSALPRLEKLLQDYRDDATAEYAANQLLHSLVELERWDELRAWVAELSADETFLANKPALRETLQHVREVLASL